MAVAGGAMPALRVKLRDGTPVAEHSESRPLTAIQQDMEAAEATLRSGLSVWVPSVQFGDLRQRMAPQGALVDAPKGPDTRTCAQRHDDELKALRMEVELLGRRLEKLEGKLAQELRIRTDLEAKLARWEADS